MVRFSAADWCFLKPGMDAGAYYRALREMGVEAAEMVAPERFDAAKEAGLRLRNIGGHKIEMALNRPEREVGMESIRRAMEVARVNGVEQVIVFTGKREGISMEAGVRECVAALKDLATEATRAGVVLTLEAFNVFDHPDYMADSSACALEIVRAVDSPAVRMLYDLYHMHRMGEDVVREVRENLEWIGHLHVAGSPGRGVPVGRSDDQVMDYGEIVSRICEAGYAGWWGFEFRTKGEPLEELRAAVEVFRAAGRSR